jgi:hypothetical protein
MIFMGYILLIKIKAQHPAHEKPVSSFAHICCGQFCGQHRTGLPICMIRKKNLPLMKIKAVRLRETALYCGP